MNIDEIKLLLTNYELLTNELFERITYLLEDVEVNIDQPLPEEE